MKQDFDLHLNFDRIVREVVRKVIDDGYLEVGVAIGDEAQRFIELQVYWWLVKHAEREHQIDIIADRCYTDIIQGSIGKNVRNDFVA